MLFVAWYEAPCSVFTVASPEAPSIFSESGCGLSEAFTSFRCSVFVFDDTVAE